MPLDATQLALIAGGTLLGAVGCWLLFHKRKARKAAERLRLAGESPESAPIGTIARLTEPTRLSIALCALVLGYHLIAWAFPPHVLAVQLAREWWWVWFLAGAGVVAMSLVMDRIDREPRDRYGSGAGGEGGG